MGVDLELTCSYFGKRSPQFAVSDVDLELAHWDVSRENGGPLINQFFKKFSTEGLVGDFACLNSSVGVPLTFAAYMVLD